LAVEATAQGVEVRRAQSAEEVGAALTLRHAVFCDEQGVPVADELDGRDDEATHLVAIAERRLVGACRLLLEPDGTARFGRLAVAPARRGEGIAAALLAAAESEARAQGARRMELAAQTQAQEMYERRGFEVLGEPFSDAGLPHVAMEKALA
jgi:putative N-acetyltransferase (TIGR04045 family)